MELMFQPLRKYADFSGRARRQEYWLFQLLMVLVGFVVGIVVGIFAGLSGDGGPSPAIMTVIGIFSILVLGAIIPSIAVSVRRLHDTDKSGWMLLIAFIPFIGGLIVLVFTVLPGTPGPNRFGPDPKGGADPQIFA